MAAGHFGGSGGLVAARAETLLLGQRMRKGRLCRPGKLLAPFGCSAAAEPSASRGWGGPPLLASGKAA